MEAINFDEIKKLMLTKMMLTNSPEQNFTGMIMSMVLLGFINYLFSVLPALLRSLTDTIKQRMKRQL